MKIQDAKIPPTANLAWLRLVGFKSSNDRSLLQVLKFVGLIDESGAPTERWRSYRSRSESGRVLAQCVKEGYSSLFETYSNAHERTEQELKDFFSEKTDAGRQAVSKTVATFNNLCALSDFSEALSESSESIEEKTSEEGEGPHIGALKEKVVKSNGANLLPTDIGGGVTININIQLTLPAEMDRVGYGEFFAALRKHLMEPPKASEISDDWVETHCGYRKTLRPLRERPKRSWQSTGHPTLE